jgi:thiamine biosynthesis lipoprotein ApbE
VFVLGENAGLELVEDLPGVEVTMILANGQESESSGFWRYLQGGA